jgi:hypothetical protein
VSAGGLCVVDEVAWGWLLRVKGFLSLESMPPKGAIVDEEAVAECTSESEILMVC